MAAATLSSLLSIALGLESSLSSTIAASYLPRQAVKFCLNSNCVHQPACNVLAIGVRDRPLFKHELYLYLTAIFSTNSFTQNPRATLNIDIHCIPCYIFWRNYKFNCSLFSQRWWKLCEEFALLTNLTPQLSCSVNAFQNSYLFPLPVFVMPPESDWILFLLEVHTIYPVPRSENLQRYLHLFFQGIQRAADTQTCWSVSFAELYFTVFCVRFPSFSEHFFLFIGCASEFQQFS